jgi:tetratricopeptide (TPR) repeat protein
MGALYSYTKDLSHAESTFRKAAVFAEATLARNPEDDAIGQQLGSTFVQLSNLRRQMGDQLQALAYAEKALVLLLKSKTLHPGEEELHYSVSSAYTSVGMGLAALGQLRAGLEKYGESAAILERIVQKDPSKLRAQRSLMFTYSHIGDTLGNPNRTNLGETAGAAEAYGKMAATAKRLYDADPADERAKSDYGIALTRAASLLPAERAREKQEMLRSALQLAEEAVKSNPANLSEKMQIAFVCLFLGEAYDANGQKEKAAETFRQGLRAAEPVMDAGNATLTTATIMMNRHLAVYAARRGDSETALSHGRRAVAITEPDSPAMKGRPETMRTGLLPRGSSALGLAYAELARRNPGYAVEARRWLSKSIEQFRAIEKRPTYSAASRRERKVVETALEGLR